MTFDVSKWETKHTHALLICVGVTMAVIFLHKEERRWAAGALGIVAAVLAFA